MYTLKYLIFQNIYLSLQNKFSLFIISKLNLYLFLRTNLVNFLLYSLDYLAIVYPSFFKILYGLQLASRTLAYFESLLRSSYGLCSLGNFLTDST